MRCLNKNKTKFWIVNIIGYTDEVDTNGFLTGAKVPSYTVPLEVSFNIMPKSSKIGIETFGLSEEVTNVIVSNSEILNKQTLIFKELPIGNYEKTYDYKVIEIMKSLNSFLYGVRGR